MSILLIQGPSQDFPISTWASNSLPANLIFATGGTRSGPLYDEPLLEMLPRRTAAGTKLTVELVRALAYGAVAIDTRDFNRSARLVVEIAVTVRILAEVAVHTMHPLLQMNVIEMNRFLEPVRIDR